MSYVYRRHAESLPFGAQGVGGIDMHELAEILQLDPLYLQKPHSAAYYSAPKLFYVVFAIRSVVDRLLRR